MRSQVRNIVRCLENLGYLDDYLDDSAVQYSLYTLRKKQRINKTTYLPTKFLQHNHPNRDKLVAKS